MAKEKTVIIDDTSDEKAALIQKKVNERFEAANEKTFAILEEFIAGGYEENLAKILVYLPKERQKKALQKLPEETQKKVSALLDSFLDKKNSDADVLSAVGFALKSAGFFGEKIASQVLDEKDVLLMNMMRENADSLFSKNPMLALNLERYFVNMEILTALDDRSIQIWLREVSSAELALGLKESSKEVQDKIFNNMSRRAATMLREDMEFIGPVKKSDILECQRQLFETLKRLEKNGSIVIPLSALNLE